MARDIKIAVYHRAHLFTEVSRHLINVKWDIDQRLKNNYAIPQEQMVPGLPLSILEYQEHKQCCGVLTGNRRAGLLQGRLSQSRNISHLDIPEPFTSVVWNEVCLHHVKYKIDMGKESKSYCKYVSWTHPLHLQHRSSGHRGQCAIKVGGHRFHLEEPVQWDSPQGLLPSCPLQHSITAKLNLRMTDAANQGWVSEVKSISIRWPFPLPFRVPISASGLSIGTNES